MEPEEMLDVLQESDVVESDGESVGPTEAFRERRNAIRARLAEGQTPVDEQLVAACGGVTSEGNTEERLLANAQTISESSELDAEAATAAALAVDRIERPPATEGVPEGFVPLRGEEIEGFLARNPTAVLYFWGHDCDPCDSVRETFDEFRENDEIPEDVALAAICSEDCDASVGERYQIAAVPTVLFCANGHPDSRLVGVSHGDAFRSELAIIAEA